MNDDISRRRILNSSGIALTAGLAGCLGDEGTATEEDPGSGDGTSPDGTDPNGTEDQYSEFDSADPEFPQLTSTLLDAGFETGTMDDLERMQESQRDEPRYGDPVQTTSDGGETIDPDTLQFAVVPTEDPTVYEDTMDPLIENIASETGKEVNYNPLDSYAAQVEAMRSERLHIAGFSTGTVPFAVNLAGAVPFSIQISDDGAFGYRLWLVTQADNDEITELADLADKNVAHADPSSNSGNLAPRALFKNQGITPDEDYEVTYSGGHEQSALGVYNDDYDAAPVCSTCFARVAREGNLDADSVKCIWASDPFPTTGWSYRYNLTSDVREGIQAAFLDYDYEDTEIAEVFEGRGTWVDIDYATVWDIILQIQEDLEVEYETGEMGE